MTTSNPYAPPSTPGELKAYPPGTLTLFKALGFVLGSALLFAVIGALLGLMIGVVVPEYYQQLFDLTSSGRAVAAGMVLGFMQGGGAGIAIGIVLCAIIAWMQVRMQMAAAMRDR